MGILDDAIRDHLELKKRHGAPDRELRQLEDEALGPGDQPDPFTGSGLFEGLGERGSTATSEAPLPPTDGGEDPTRIVGEVTAPPEPPPSEPPAPLVEAEPSPPAAEPEHPPAPLGPTASEEPPGAETAEHPGEPPPPPREVDPSELESLDTLGGEGDTAIRPAGADPAEPEPEPEPESAAGPEPAVTIPPPPPEGREERPESLSGPAEAGALPEELLPEPTDAGEAPPAAGPGKVRPGLSDTPTQEHPPPEPPSEEVALPPAEPWPEPDAPRSEEGAAPPLYDFETDEALAEPAPAAEPPSDEFESVAPAETADSPDDDVDQGTVEYDRPELEEEADEKPNGDDLLSASPDFIDEETEDEDLWFEKRPPEDFDFEEDR